MCLISWSAKKIFADVSPFSDGFSMLSVAQSALEKDIKHANILKNESFTLTSLLALHALRQENMFDFVDSYHPIAW